MGKRGKLGNKLADSHESRPIPVRAYKLFILIVCEDEKTEPYYFDGFKKLFPARTCFIKEVGTGKKPLAIVKHAISEKNSFLLEKKKEYDSVWVVFDVDDEGQNVKTAASFKQALDIAKENSIKVAASNEVFELWLLLHFSDVESSKSMGRKEIYTKIEEAIRLKKGLKSFMYQHGKTTVVDLVRKYGNEGSAMRRARGLETFNAKRNILAANPSTQMHHLVKFLREWVQYFSIKK